MKLVTGFLLGILLITYVVMTAPIRLAYMFIVLIAAIGGYEMTDPDEFKVDIKWLVQKLSGGGGS